MPVKKQKSTTGKKAAPKRKIEKEIQEAVKQIPEFLFTKVEAPAPPPTPPKKEKPTFSKAHISNYREYQKRRLLFWTTIILFTAAILSLWFWNISTLWQDAKLSDSPEKNLWNEAKTGLTGISETTNETDQTLQNEEQIKQELKNQIEAEITKAKIKNAINQNLTEYFASSTTSTITNTTTKTL